MFSKKEADTFYATIDPWGFRTNAADAERRRRIVETVTELVPEDGDHDISILDIGAGEGFITEALPAFATVSAYELSDKAASRFAKHVKRFKPTGILSNFRRFDIILITGALYEDYDWREMVRMAIDHLSPTGYVVTCNIADREYAPAINMLQDEANLWQRTVYEFPYIRSDTEQFTQRLRVFAHAGAKGK